MKWIVKKVLATIYLFIYMVFLTSGSRLNSTFFDKLFSMVVMFPIFHFFAITGLFKFFINKGLGMQFSLLVFTLIVFTPFFLEKWVNRKIREMNRDISFKKRYILEFSVPFVITYLMLNFFLAGFMLYFFIDPAKQHN